MELLSKIKNKELYLKSESENKSLTSDNKDSEQNLGELLDKQESDVDYNVGDLVNDVEYYAAKRRISVNKFLQTDTKKNKTSRSWIEKPWLHSTW